MTAPRRLRAQDERAPEAWRRVAESRPGFATYPDTREGDPSWWRRHGDERPPRFAAGGLVAGPGSRGDDRIPLVLSGCNGAGFELPPPPVDGETCKQWCGFCHLGTDAPAPTPAPPPFPGVPPAAEADEPETWCVCGAPDSGPCPRCLPADAVARAVELPATMRQRIDFDIAPDPVVPQRRRWWHRYTRRTR